MKRIFALVLALCLLMGCSAMAQSTLNVSGSGTVYMEADTVSASIGVNMNGEDMETLQNQANATIAAICEALVEAGMDEKDIATHYLYISPRYDYSGATEQIIGYSISNFLSIRTKELDMIGTYIDLAFAAGANSFDSISFTVEDNSEGRREALKLAVADAQAKAQTIAAAAGKELGELISITEGEQADYWGAQANGSVGYARAESADAAKGTTVRAAQVQVTAKVQMVYGMN